MQGNNLFEILKFLEKIVQGVKISLRSRQTSGKVFGENAYSIFFLSLSIMSVTVKPYGEWASPISADDISSASLRVQDLLIGSDGSPMWLEGINKYI